MENGGPATFGALLRHFRLEAAMSQETLAERARMSVETISALERSARRSPYRETVAQLAHALGLSPEDRTRLKAAAARHGRPASKRPHGDASDGAPPSSPVGVPPHNLPSALSRLIGREQAATEVAASIGTHRLVTLVGTWGVGKTRTALLVADRILSDFPGGVWFVELAALGRSALVAKAVARALGVHESPGRSLLASIVEVLRRERSLLVLDNCEHVLADARIVAAAVLRGCANVRILATSREPLGVNGEQTYRIPPLDPPCESAVTAAEAAAYAAVELFVDRAQAADGRFSLCNENARAVAKICRRLDGIPLGIELAAARIKVVAPHQLAQILDERFHILSNGDRAALPRLQSMRAAIDWSFALLSKAERTLAGRLAIFAATWTLEDAEAVCPGEALGAEQILDILGALVNKSLVIAEPSNSEVRYRYLASIRAHALEQLEASGERETVAERHALWGKDGRS